MELLIHDPELVEVDEIPEDLGSAVPDLRFRIAAGIEPINPPHEAWQLVDAVLDAVGARLGRPTYGIRSGRVEVWRDGQRT